MQTAHRLPHAKFSRNRFMVIRVPFIFNFAMELQSLGLHHPSSICFCAFEVWRSKNSSILFTPPSGSCCWFSPQFCSAMILWAPWGPLWGGASPQQTMPSLGCWLAGGHFPLCWLSNQIRKHSCRKGFAYQSSWNHLLAGKRTRTLQLALGEPVAFSMSFSLITVLKNLYHIIRHRCK